MLQIKKKEEPKEEIVEKEKEEIFQNEENNIETIIEPLEEKEEELSTKGFIKKYGVDADDYVNLRFAKKESLKNVSPWRWTDPRLQNALRQLSSKTTNPQFVRMLQGQMTPVASLKTRGPRANLQSTKTKFG